jgi:hypothetical protein
MMLHGLTAWVCVVGLLAMMFGCGYVSARWAPRRWLGILIGVLWLALGVMGLVMRK